MQVPHPRVRSNFRSASNLRRTPRFRLVCSTRGTGLVGRPRHLLRHSRDSGRCLPESAVRESRVRHLPCHLLARSNGCEPFPGREIFRVKVHRSSKAISEVRRACPTGKRVGRSQCRAARNRPRFSCAAAHRPRCSCARAGVRLILASRSQMGSHLRPLVMENSCGHLLGHGPV
jgi:hypothetical protein